MIGRVTAVRLFLLWMCGWRLPKPTEEAPTRDFFIYVLQKLLTRHWPVSFITLMVGSFTLPVVVYFVWESPLEIMATYLFLSLHAYAFITMEEASPKSFLWFLVVPILSMTGLALILKAGTYMLMGYQTPLGLWYTVQYALIVTAISVAITRRPGSGIIFIPLPKE